MIEGTAEGENKPLLPLFRQGGGSSKTVLAFTAPSTPGVGHGEKEGGFQKVEEMRRTGRMNSGFLIGKEEKIYVDGSNKKEKPKDV